MRKITIASLVGSIIEWYDFYIYGTASALVFSSLFFPSFSTTAGTLAAFGTFASGWLARPVGGVIAGHLGDRVGRKSILVFTMLLMGSATVAIGLLPTYDSIGVWAPALLVIFRLIQGLAVGGEWGGAVLMTAEHAPRKSRGRYAAWPQAGVPFGLLLGTGMFALVSSLPKEDFMTWGWRIPFLASIVLIGAGLFIRLRVSETPTFRQLQETQATSRLPLIEALRNYRKKTILAIGAQLGPNVFFITFAIYILTYATQHAGLPRTDVLVAVTVACAVELVALPAWGAVSDRIGRRPVFGGGLLFLALYVFIFFWLVNTGSAGLVWLALIVGLGLAHPATYGVQASFFAELFEPRVRYSGMSFAYQVSGLIAAAPLLIIATLLVDSMHGEPWLFASYLSAIGLISAICVYLAQETAGADTDRATVPGTSASIPDGSPR